MPFPVPLASGPGLSAAAPSLAGGSLLLAAIHPPSGGNCYLPQWCQTSHKFYSPFHYFFTMTAPLWKGAWQLRKIPNDWTHWVGSNVLTSHLQRGLPDMLYCGEQGTLRNSMMGERKEWKEGVSKTPSPSVTGNLLLDPAHRVSFVLKELHQKF